MIPPANGNNAVITVKVGGDRSGVNGVTALAGVVLGFYDAATGGSPVFTCTSDADGDCSITVPDTQQGGVNRDRRFYVRQVSAPGGLVHQPDAADRELGRHRDPDHPVRLPDRAQLRKRDDVLVARAPS